MTKAIAGVWLVTGAIIGAVLISHTGALQAQAQTSQQTGPWQIVAQVGAYPQAAAWRITSLTGEMNFCTFLGNSWLKCLPVSPPEK